MVELAEAFRDCKWHIFLWCSFFFPHEYVDTFSLWYLVFCFCNIDFFDVVFNSLKLRFWAKPAACFTSIVEVLFIALFIQACRNTAPEWRLWPPELSLEHTAADSRPWWNHCDDFKRERAETSLTAAWQNKIKSQMEKKLNSWATVRCEQARGNIRKKKLILVAGPCKNPTNGPRRAGAARRRVIAQWRAGCQDPGARDRKRLAAVLAHLAFGSSGFRHRQPSRWNDGGERKFGAGGSKPETGQCSNHRIKVIADFRGFGVGVVSGLLQSPLLCPSVWEYHPRVRPLVSSLFFPEYVFES